MNAPDRPWIRLALGLVLLGTGAAGDILVDTDFGDAREPIRTSPAARDPDVFSGVLPGGWQEDSTGWADVRVRTLPLEEQGERFLRIEVRDIVRGRVQLMHLLPNVEQETLFRLTFEARNWTPGFVEYGLRRRGAPYTFLWNAIERFSTAWHTVTHDFAAGPEASQVGLWINLTHPGRVDLKRLRLVRLTREQIEEELRRNHPDGGPANVARSHRFPLGLPTGWSLDRALSDGDVIDIGPDPGAADDGIPPLRIRALRAGVAPLFRTEPFRPPVPLEPHGVAFRQRGSGRWTARLYRDGQAVAWHRFDAGPAWSRERFVFEPSLFGGVFQVELEGEEEAELWFDHFQVGPWRRLEEVSPPAPAQVALGLPPSDADVARIQFLDEPARVRYAVVGDRAGATLKRLVVNVYGEERALPDLPLSGDGALDTGDFAFDAMPHTPLGSFRIEAWVEREGAAISPVCELLVHRLHRPRHEGRDAPDSPFGMHSNATTRHLVMAKAIGINWTRLHDAGLPYIGWWNLEPSPGEWRFFDADLQRYRDHSLLLLGQLGTAPGWASYYSRSGLSTFGYFDKFFQPLDLAAFAHYVRVVAGRYREVISDWDIWNEPWIAAWWAVDYDPSIGGRAGYLTSEHPQADYVALKRAAREALAPIQPGARIVGFNTTTGRQPEGTRERISGDEWTRGVLEAGGLEISDVIGYHHYSGLASAGHPDDVIERGLEVAVGPLRDGSGALPRPVWMTEGSPVAHAMCDGMYHHTVPWGAQDRHRDTAEQLGRYMLSLMAQGVERWFLYSLHTHRLFSETTTPWVCLVTQDGHLHPMGAAHSHFAYRLEGMRFLERLDLGNDVFAFLFEGEDRAVAVLSSRGTVNRPIPRPPGVDIADLFGNPPAPNARFTGALLFLEIRGRATDLRDHLARHGVP